MTLTPVDPGNAVAVTSYLESARKWLATAVEQTGPEQIARAKAEIATAAEATKQLGLSKEIRDDAAEMVRRAEYALAKSIRKGQADGTVNTQGQGSSGTWADGQVRRSPNETKSRVYDLLPTGADRAHAAALNDVQPEQFDAALAEARAEGNLSRANVARKARDLTGTAPRATRRAPLTDFSRDTAEDLLRLAERFDRITKDDRFRENRDAISARAGGSFNRAMELLNQFGAAIRNDEATP